MGRKKNEGVPSVEQTMQGFEPFKNGLVNCHLPHDYNWLVGYAIPTLREINKKPVNRITIPTAKINGRHIHA